MDFNFKKIAYLLMSVVSVFLFLFLMFAVYSFIEKLVYIKSLGGLSALNYPEVTGHLVIMFFGLGCLYFSIKATRKIKSD
ncbi:hypothetical protein LU631_20675 [Erwinia tracheiphila]|uniref:Uncharacterized protein n=1 Tax=Erwinia tracheiphila TaxID=65700 RepID=A0A0M2K997_9GAMM|nr:hypothetical protein [Erwinia tracheiphila]EOS95892.1 hypothetical protein ETR_05820 [Erwinia tracheiphila PSU-1]KKF35494.1 hypothetical protein SY86_08750 [Erwinia tracheiphila]UIA87159.1 hypothetical protein LU631_20675 [Erwinia tracheiphila]UIA95519.1 hypothetical protein LU633_19125 [Erwinia tracheiphila]